MDKQIIAVDFRQEDSLDQVVKERRTQLSSREIAWQNLHFEYHRYGSHETPEHRPIHHTLAIQTEGLVRAERQLAGRCKQESIEAGDVCLVPAFTSHKIRAEGEQGLIFLSLDPAFLRQIAYDATKSSAVELVPQFAKPDPLVCAIARSLQQTLQDDPLNSQFYAESLSLALAAHLLQHYSAKDNAIQQKETHLPEARIQKAVDYINDCLSDTLSVELIAKVAGLSQYHFSRSFNQVMGLSPWQYVIQQRIKAAKRLLIQSRQSILLVSQQLGFSTQTQFTRFFKKHVGISPTDYRKICSKEDS